MNSISNQNLRAILTALTAFLLFNIADAILKDTYNHYNSGLSATYVILFELAILTLFSPLLGGVSSIYKTTKLKLHIIRAIGGATCWLFFIIGIEYLDFATNYAILLSMSFWATLFAFLFLKQIIGYHRWIAICIGFIGVLVVLQPGLDSFKLASLLPLFSAFGFATMALASRYIGNKEPLYVMAFYILMFDLLFVAGYTQITDGWQMMQTTHIPYFLSAGIFYCTGLILCSKAFAMGDTSAVAPMQYSQIIWGSLIGYLIFKEIPEISTIIGAIIIVLSGIYLIYRENIINKTD